MYVCISTTPIPNTTTLPYQRPPHPHPTSSKLNEKSFTVNKKVRNSSKPFPTNPDQLPTLQVEKGAETGKEEKNQSKQHQHTIPNRIQPEPEQTNKTL